MAGSPEAAAPYRPRGRRTPGSSSPAPSDDDASSKRFATVVQLLVDEKGNELVRFAYSTDGTARRGPVTLRGRDLERFRAALAEHPAIGGALGMVA